MNDNKIIFELEEDEESSDPLRIAIAFIIVFCAVSLQAFSSVTPGF